MQIKSTPHARRQAESRNLPVDAIETVVNAKLAGKSSDSAAVFAGRLREARGGLIGSNGDTVWAIVRDGSIVTIMLRRSDQPSTPGALRVRRVEGATR